MENNSINDSITSITYNVVSLGTLFTSLITKDNVTFIVGIIVSIMAIRHYYYATKKIKNRRDNS